VRDPEGWVEDDGRTIIRHAYRPLPASHFLRTPAAVALIQRGLLTPFSLSGSSQVIADRIDFPTYPWEWVPSQLFEAAHTTLEVLESAIEAGYELKDASARNVLFRSNKPEFIDHFSFQSITRSEWWAYGQFLRHFIFPLAVYKYRSIGTAAIFRAHIDGINRDLAHDLLGRKCYFNRVGLALIKSGRDAAAHAETRENNERIARIKGSHHQDLISFLRWQLASICPRLELKDSTWKKYEDERDHYPGESVNHKRETVARWIASISPACVIDLGCNQGEFSLIAANAAPCAVLAVDGDIGALERCRLRLDANQRVTTVLTSLDDINGGRGWSGTEYIGLKERLEKKSEVVMALALIHHLVIGSSIPLDRLASFLAECTKDFCIVELISPNDPQVCVLAQQRSAETGDRFSLDRQRQALLKYFSCVEEVPLPGTARTLALLRLRSANQRT
jgi:hypothetical protein